MALLGASPQVRTQRVYSTTHLRFFGLDPSEHSYTKFLNVREN